MKVKIIGVYAVEAPEPCHLVELQISDYIGHLDLAKFTQERGYDESSWQVPWDERVLNAEGTRDLPGRFPQKIEVNGEVRLAFFFHYLDFKKPLLTPAGRLVVPDAKILPKRLAFSAPTGASNVGAAWTATRWIGSTCVG